MPAFPTTRLPTAVSISFQLNQAPCRRIRCHAGKARKECRVDFQSGAARDPNIRAITNTENTLAAADANVLARAPLGSIAGLKSWLDEGPEFSIEIRAVLYQGEMPSALSERIVGSPGWALIQPVVQPMTAVSRWARGSARRETPPCGRLLLWAQEHVTAIELWSKCFPKAQHGSGGRLMSNHFEMARQQLALLRRDLDMVTT